MSKKSSIQLQINVNTTGFDQVRTPRSTRLRSTRTPTPRISERRRSLFSDKQKDEPILEENDSLDGIEPLSPTTRSKSQNRENIDKLTPKLKRDNKNVTPKKHKENENNIYLTRTSAKKTSTKELQKMFDNVNIRNNNKRKIKKYSSDESVHSSDEEQTVKSSENTKTKKIKLDYNGNDDLISSGIKISTKSFYSGKTSLDNIKKSPVFNILDLPNLPPLNIKKLKTKNKSKGTKLGNKGVAHKIRRSPLKKKTNGSIDDFLKDVRCKKFKSLPSKRISLDKVKEVHNILNSIGNPIEMAKPLQIDYNKNISAKFSDSEDNDTDTENSISENVDGFESHATYSINTNFLKNITLKNDDDVMLSSTNKTKKFFKSGNSSTKKEYKITKNIKVGIFSGKMCLLTKKKVNSTKAMPKTKKIFQNEQATVNDIINNWNVSPEKENSDPIVSPQILSEQTSDKIFEFPEEQEITNEITDTVKNISNVLQTQDDLHADYRNRLPYNTSDSKIIERQHLLLDFLITNNICTEENFEIFIANPDSHKEEADRIINNLVVVVNQDCSDPYEDFRCRIPYNTDNPETVEQQNIFLDFLIENEICTEDNFRIFIKDFDNCREEAEKVIESVSEINSDEENYVKNTVSDMEVDIPDKNCTVTNKLFPVFYPGRCIPIVNKFSRSKKSALWRGAIGKNQYQIDAGQKNFGAKQCATCGLVYTVHEPEEEIVHLEYHNSLDVLKFRGWIDENVVSNYLEWGNEGRIIRITSSDHPKKKERLMEVLKVVDKELGFSSYILPDEFAAFFAVRRQQIVGLCLVQFLESANRYISESGIDCCTEAYFPAKIGISRIWISPFHRRIGIASKLIMAARSNTIKGEVIDIDEIAFSAPTEDGKVFAQKITKRFDFLVYQ